MKNNRSLPKPEEIYQHFKGGLYQVLTLATHSETKETLVIYRALYGDFKTYAEPLSMFMEETDHKKYSEAKAYYRFTRVDLTKKVPMNLSEKETPSLLKEEENSCLSENENQVPLSSHKNPDRGADDEAKAMSLFMEFLDESGFDKKRNILRAIAPIATERIVNSMVVSLDLVPTGISKEADIKMIADYISARIHFDGSRLR